MADIPIGVANPTYNNANNAFNSGWFNFGDTRSDQDIFNDQAVTTALGEGKDTFVNSNGIEQTVASYERDISPPTKGSVYSNVNNAPTATSMLGLGLGMLTSGLIPGITGMIAGQGVNAAVNSMSNNSTSDTQAAQAEYEAAANAMEFPGNAPVSTPNYAPNAVTATSIAPVSTPNYAPNAVTAINTLAGIGAGLLGGPQGKDEFGVYGQDSDFATNAADENSFEGYDGSEFGGSGSLGTSYGGMEAADFAAGTGAYTSTDGITEGLVGNVASVSSVDDPAAVSQGYPTGVAASSPGFNSLSYHSMGMDAFNAMANSSAANSMASQTGNAWNAFAGADSRKGQGDSATQSDWANFQSGGTGKRGADGEYGGDPGAEGGANSGWAPSSDETDWARGQDPNDTGGDSDGSGDCFLTTAACEVLDKPDDCIELQTFRRVRDELLDHPIAKWLIRKYYREAPMKAELLRNHPNRAEISATMFNKYIPRVMVALEKGQTWKAILLYWSMSNYVKKGVL